MMTRVLIFGGRERDATRDLQTLIEHFHRILRPRPNDNSDFIIVSGGATGSDAAALLYANRMGWHCEVYHANWKRDGRAAGPIRNRRMIAEGKPDFAISFPGGRGTADMLRRVIHAGIPHFAFVD